MVLLEEVQATYRSKADNWERDLVRCNQAYWKAGHLEKVEGLSP
jgi:hypothetical protein